VGPWSEECQRRVGHARNYPMLTFPTEARV